LDPSSAGSREFQGDANARFATCTRSAAPLFSPWFDMPTCRAMKARMRLSLAVFGVFALIPCLGSCSAVVHPDVGSLNPAPAACSPGVVAVCPCIGGGTGTQVCNAGGGYDPCICGARTGNAGHAAVRAPALPSPSKN
jgi:hypothetical protein